MSTSAGCRVSRSHSPIGTVVRVTGVIDESFNEQVLLESPEKTLLVIDLDGVERITSFGVRKWVAALEKVQSRQVYFTRCRPTTVMQFNTIERFGGRGELLSLYAPYVCTSCHKLTDVLLDLRHQHADVRRFSPPPVNCPQCHAAADLDDVAEFYFAYAAQIATPQPPVEIDELMLSSANSEAPGSTPFQVEQQFEGEVTALWLRGKLDKAGYFKRLADGIEGLGLILPEGISEVGGDGLVGLQHMLTVASAELVLARVGEQLATHLAAAPSLLGKARLLSLRLSLQCSLCSERLVCDVDTEHPLSAQVCPHCGGALVSSLAPEVFDRLPLTPTPARVRTFLAAHPNPPLMNRPRPPPPNPFEAAAETFGRYQLLRRLGIGGMAEVFLARQTGAGGFEKRLVVKRILPQFSESQSFVAMFLREANLAARISHPNVVQIFDLGQVGSRFYIAMEYVRGADLRLVLSAAHQLKRPLPFEFVCRIGADVCAGLHAAHTSKSEEGTPLQITHRDVSPHNVLISVDGQVKIADFGVAKGKDSAALTPTDALKGKLSYMAPEQALGGDSRDGRVDVFSVGAMLFEMLCGARPFQRENDVQTLRAILVDPILPVRHFRTDTPTSLDAVLTRALERDPQLRLTADALRAALEGVITELGRPAGPRELGEWVTAVLRDAESAGLVTTALGKEGSAETAPSSTEPGTSSTDTGTLL